MRDAVQKQGTAAVPGDAGLPGQVHRQHQGVGGQHELQEASRSGGHQEEGGKATKTEDFAEHYQLVPGLCVVEPAPAPTAAGLIEYAELYRPEQAWGYVVATGPSRIAGTAVPFEPGDPVVFQRWAGNHIRTEDGDVLVVMRQDDIQCIIQCEDDEDDT